MGSSPIPATEKETHFGFPFFLSMLSVSACWIIRASGVSCCGFGRRLLCMLCHTLIDGEVLLSYQQSLVDATKEAC